MGEGEGEEEEERDEAEGEEGEEIRWRGIRRRGRGRQLGRAGSEACAVSSLCPCTSSPLRCKGFILLLIS